MTTRPHPSPNHRTGAPRLLLVLAATFLATTGAARGGAPDAEAIGSAAGTQARTGPDGVVRVGWSRTDVEV